MGGQLRSSQARDHYIVTSLMEEAITSSQLEGASTTRKVAKEMLRTKRKPRAKHERALFYWSALRSKYWLLEFVTISSVIKKAPAKYGRAFLHAETDDNDATYFIIHQLDVITRAIENLKHYIQRSVEDQRAFEGALRTCSQYNRRQTALLRHALRRPGSDYTIAEHQSYHAVSYQTARTDLLGLESAGLSRSWKRSKALHFGPVPRFESVLREATETE